MLTNKLNEAEPFLIS